MELKIVRASTKNFQETRNWLKSSLSPYYSKKSYVLDAGCGYQNRLINKAEVHELVGVDINSDAIRNNQDISYGIKVNIEELGAVDLGKKFDLVMSYDVMEHIEAPEKFICAVSKILQPNGYFWFVTPNKLSILGLLTSALPINWLKYLSLIIFGRKTSNEVHFYGMNQINTIVRCLHTNKFDKINIVLLDALPSNKWLRKCCYPDYLLGRSGLFKNYSLRLVCMARLFNGM